jgi:hypothetical protein
MKYLIAVLWYVLGVVVIATVLAFLFWAVVIGLLQ